MRYLLGLLLVVLALASPAQAQTGTVACNRSVIYDASTNGSTQLVAAGSSMRICGYGLYAGGTVNVKLIHGTGTTCGTGTVNLTPAYQFTAQTGFVDPSSFYRGMFVPTGRALCINTSAGVAVQAIVYYVSP